MFFQKIFFLLVVSRLWVTQNSDISLLTIAFAKSQENIIFDTMTMSFFVS